MDLRLVEESESGKGYGKSKVTSWENETGSHSGKSFYQTNPGYHITCYGLELALGMGRPNCCSVRITG